ncbi:hypothetical protein [Capnocytophaga stomatis]|uniref:Uncharacterized protein n=1 Tax=Capnocytophaga stomatis TaxID=1848904 RepID=A0ABW8QC76_9FLAO|nr:hypothetical protein [Capnocytophaga stomatis]GIJ94869.1 hypothetical protein CAPN002_20870 [Capnocytophaga stomatis]
MKIVSHFLHHIDIKNSSVTTVDLELNNQNLEDYINELLDEIINNPNRRIYKFSNGNTEIKTSLYKILNNDSEIEKVVELNAQRLLQKEIDAQNFMKNKNMSIEIQKGSLLHLNFNINESKQIIICKVEHDEILNESNFEIVRGLNIRKKNF